MPKINFKSISTRASALCVLALLALSVAGLTSYWIGSRLLSNLDDLRIMSTALRNHTLIDMYHDMVRGAVYMALSADELHIARDTAAKDLEDAADAIKKAQASNRQLDLPHDVQVMLDGLEQPLSHYIATAQRAISTTFADRAHSASDVAEFQEQFRVLEELLGKTGDDLEARIVDLNQNANRFASTVSLVFCALLVVVFACVAGLSAYVVFFMLGSLRRLEVSMADLLQGKLDIDLKAQSRNDEIGDMTRAVAAFRDSAIERSRLETEAAENQRKTEAAREQAEEERRKRAEADAAVARRQGDFLASLGDGLGRMAKGDLTIRLSNNETGAFSKISSDFNSMADQVQFIAARIGDAATAVQGAAQEIGTGVSDLSARTEQQASSLEETSASIEELSATVRQNAGNAQAANQLAIAARQVAVGGGDIAGRAVGAMDRIEQSSRQVSEIVGLIQDIAFQTNILALNAAVEAARAGEAGRGFAVVANEVRALAQRSSQASKDIKDLISNTDASVREGVGLVKQAGSSLTEIVTSVKKVADIVSEIAIASQEQSSGIEQVSKAIGNMDEMTQRNAALVEETNAALQSALTQVDELREAVGFFKTGGEAHVPTVSRAPAANPVHDRLNSLAQRMSARKVAHGGLAHGGAAAAADWKEF